MRAVLLICLGAAAACAEAAGPTDAAAAAFDAFQHALRQRDESACRELLTRESAVVLAAMPWERIAAQQPLQRRGVSAVASQVHIDVLDPNTGGRPATFVVVREFGHWVVDLVASAAMNAQTVDAATPMEASGSREQFEPRELTPADLDRIREHELSQPPR